MSTQFNLAATKFVPRHKKGNATNNSGSTNKSVGETKPKSQNSTQINSQMMKTPSTSTHQSQQQQLTQQSPQQTFKSLLYWEPKDSNGSVLDEAYCIECIPSDFWQRLGDLNDTIRSFEKCFGTTFK